MKVSHFTIDKTAKLLFIEFEDKSVNDAQLSFEFLRVCSPSQETSHKKANLVSHKKNVLLNTLESVAKHGYRLIFDDNYSVIFSDDYMYCLVTEREQRWQEYLDALQASGHSREAMIDIKQL
jgi:DUF971 family protein